MQNFNLYRLFLFLLLNFGALYIGGLYTSKGVPSEWYLQLNKAPWTPPGWMFGVAWFTIMVCFSIYLTLLWPQTEQKNTFITLYILQLFLNILWNPLFFRFHYTVAALFTIVGLTILIALYIFRYYKPGGMTLLLAPYFIWLLIASSLNAYIVFKN